MQNPAIQCILGGKMVRNAVHDALLLNTFYTVETPFHALRPLFSNENGVRNNPCAVPT